MRHYTWLGALFALVLFALPVHAQSAEPGITFRLSRDFGYGGFSGDIQGTFTYRVDGPDDLARVEFLLDDEIIGTDVEAPFRFQFNTGSYALGRHTLAVVGYTTDGRVLRSEAISREFVSAGAGWESVSRIIVPLFAVILLAVLVPAAFSLVQERRNPTPLGAPRKYGMAGGTICPNCGRPYSRHIWAPNVLVGKLDRCPHCGKWRIVQRMGADALRAAEAAELEGVEAEVPEPLSADEKLRRQLDESRFE